MDGLAGERGAVLTAVAGEREAVLYALSLEREAVLKTVETIVDRTLEKLEQSSQTTASHAISGSLRGARQLLVLVFCGVLALLGVTWFLARNLILTAQGKR
jgi:hypothetical protein